MNTDHESAKVRKHEGMLEVGRTASNSIELVHSERRENNREKPMNYGEWSKSVELNRTLTPKCAAE